jgi:hypothetical protein
MSMNPPRNSLEDKGASHHDFDFIFGGWKVDNRKLRDMTNPLCREWIEFSTHALAQPILGGVAHYQRTWSDHDSADGPWESFTLRQFDPSGGVWRIWQASTSAPGRLPLALTGSFSHGVGLFMGDDTLAGRLAKVRFEWINRAPGRARSSQAFSFDAGWSWHLNWVMELTRISRRKPSDHRG